MNNRDLAHMLLQNHFTASGSLLSAPKAVGPAKSDTLDLVEPIETLRNMVVLTGVLAAVVSLATSDCGVAGARHLLNFEIMQPPHDVPMPDGLVLNPFGWSTDGYGLMVSEKGSARNLLIQNPHGPEPFDLYAWSHFQKYYPDVREISLKRSRDALVIDLRDVQSVHDAEADEEAKRKGEQLAGPSGKFIGGTVHICWRDSKT